MTGILASVRDLSVIYHMDTDEATALDGLNLYIAAGERLAVIGESGSGKTTLALALAGLLPLEARVSGTLHWPGLGHAPQPGRDIGFVFQDPGASLNPVLRVGDQIAEVATTHLGLSRREALALTRDLLAQVRLPDPDTIRSAYPHQLSGGQRQRVAIAAAIAARPRLLIADEPTSALDTIVQARIVALLGELVAQEGMSLLFVTHDIALASGFADRIAVLHKAKLVEIGPAEQVLRRPENPYTASLIAGHIGLDTPSLLSEAQS